ncbi:hypothetical protein MHO82_20995 [Vibrio sp. Of7-15]|nr:hypothetical protein [Vibrio sp. Of7-15]MCG7499346.1 hypothetical protein [Vibrio sp. Of7-15]
MSRAIPPKTNPALRSSKSGDWEEKHPEKCPVWLNLIGWLFVLVPFFFI